MEQLVIKAYSKLNITMEVLGRREDGYHDIRSIMQFVSLADTVELTRGEEFSFWCSNSQLCNEDNLAVKAYRLMESRFPVLPVGIRLHKSVPCMSGMGGGSADAAAVLRGICRMNGIELPKEQLLALGAELGADVPACLVGGTLLAEGIGEKLTELVQRKPLHFNVIMPKVAFSTPEMYSKIDRHKSFAAPVSPDIAIKAVEDAAPAQVARIFYNSFEQVAEPGGEISAAKKLLMSSGAYGASMTGAGSAVFGIYMTKESADKAHRYLSGQGETVFRCHSVAKNNL